MLAIQVGYVHAAEDEYRLKAAYIGNFTLFIDWPELSSPNAQTDDSFHIAVIHDRGIGNALEELGANQLIKEKKVIVTHFNESEAMALFDSDSPNKKSLQFSIIYISSPAKNLLERVIASTKHLPILIITETSGGSIQGAHINLFQTQDQYLRFEINEASFHQSHLRISSRLLKLRKNL